MHCSLESHPKGYSLSQKEGLYSLSTFSCAEYAERHNQLSLNTSENYYGHRVCAFLEKLPFVGILVATIERIVVLVYRYFVPKNDGSSHLLLPLQSKINTIPHNMMPKADSYKTQDVNPPSHTLIQSLFDKSSKKEETVLNETKIKMLKNAEKAIKEHRERSKNDPAYVTLAEGLPSLEAICNPKSLPPITFEYCSAEAQGRRDNMEDAHFYIPLDHGVVMGLFDGHGGSQVANFASEFCKENIKRILNDSDLDMRLTLQKIIDDIHAEVKKRSEWNSIGSTAVLVFINKYTLEVDIATLSDSEANIYRNYNGRLKSIPPSPIRDWSCRRDAARAAIAYEENPENQQTLKKTKGWVGNAKPKQLRFPNNTRFSTNISRSIGDIDYKEYFFDPQAPEKSPPPAIIEKAKISINVVKRGDYLIVACDGLKDFVQEKEIAHFIECYSGPQDSLAQKLVNFALEKGSKDNVTVLAIKIV